MYSTFYSIPDLSIIPSMHNYTKSTSDRNVHIMLLLHTLSQDMMKHSSNAPKAYSDLQMALDRMLKVLKNLNDSLHVVGLKGFPVLLTE